MTNVLNVMRSGFQGQAGLDEAIGTYLYAVKDLPGVYHMGVFHTRAIGIRGGEILYETETLDAGPTTRNPDTQSWDIESRFRKF